jgi:hypothetical protein
MKQLVISLILLLLFASQVKAQQPEWTTMPDIDPDYYFGIGSCEKAVPDYREIATKRALSLIAEQIQVNISSSNELYTSEYNFRFNQVYSENIVATSAVTLQDYELYQAWEDSAVCFVFFRLSKQLYRENLSKTYDIALDNSSVCIARADSLLSSGKIEESIGSYLRASKFLEPVIVNSFIPDKYARVVNQWNEIQSQLLKILFDTGIRPLKEKFLITKGNIFNADFEVETFYKGPDTKFVMNDIPIIYELSGNLNAFEKKVIYTDNRGIASNNIINIYNEALAYTIYCKIDFEGYLDRYKDYLMMDNPEFDNLISNCKILIEIIPVTVKINSDEKTFSRKNPSAMIKNELANYLRNQNIAVLDNEKKSDYIIDLKADSRQGNCYNEMCSSFIDVEYEVYKNSNDSLLISGNMEPVKGLSLSFEAAASQAYKNVKEDIKPKLGKVILPYLK